MRSTLLAMVGLSWLVSACSCAPAVVSYQDSGSTHDGAASDAAGRDHAVAADSSTAADHQAADQAAGHDLASGADRALGVDQAVGVDRVSGGDRAVGVDTFTPVDGGCPQCGCTGCGSGEACVLGRCAPLAVLLASPANIYSQSFWCPSGYREVGHWRSGPGFDDSGLEGADFEGFRIDSGWLWICSADPSRVTTVAALDDCGGASTPCSGAPQGQWHVGQSSFCGVSENRGVDGSGRGIKSGWLHLCVHGGASVKVESGGDDCGGAGGPGCGSWREVGAWHTMPVVCNSGNTGIGAGGAAIVTGWMRLCDDSDDYVPVESSTLTGKVLAGYQGWFGAAGDGSQRNIWVHWFHSQTPAPEYASFDLWPNLSEYDADELWNTTMVYGDSSPARLYSAYTPKTVARHFRWLADNGIDGVFLQRFVSEIDNGVNQAFRDHVTQNAMAGAESYGRVFTIEYDISGADVNGLVDRIAADWRHLVDDVGVTASDRYLRHAGRPLVAVWGWGFDQRADTPQQVLDLLDAFHNATDRRHRATVMGGVPGYWRTGNNDARPEFAAAFRSFDVINPWTVGRYSNESGVASWNSNRLGPDVVEAANNGRDYLAVVWPGFSWYNLNDGAQPLNQIPRQGGRFFWRQIYEAQASGANALFIAMFDEVDEGTAIFKAAPTQADLPTTGSWLALDQDGESVPTDWYLRLGGAAAKSAHGQIPNLATLPLR